MSDARPETLTVVIPTKNSEAVIGDCLSSVAWADEIIVVDMSSTDKTVSFCNEYPQCRVVERNDYIFANVNHGFDLATSDWIMRLDSDERVTPELAEEIKAVLAAPPAGVSGFNLWERPVMLGVELTHGFGRRHHRPMIFRRGVARYPVEREHEGLETTGRWQDLKNGYMHLNYLTVSQYLTKTDYYTDRDLERYELPPQRPSIVAGVREPARAVYLYYLKQRGYRDGWVGFVDAGMRGMYQFVWWAKVRHRWEEEHGKS